MIKDGELKPCENDENDWIIHMLRYKFINNFAIG